MIVITNLKNKVNRILKNDNAVQDAAPNALYFVIFMFILIILIQVIIIGVDVHNTTTIADNVSRKIQLSGKVDSTDFDVFYDNFDRNTIDSSKVYMDIYIDGSDTPSFSTKTYSGFMDDVPLQLGTQVKVVVHNVSYLGMKDIASLELPISGRGFGVSEMYWKE